MPDNEIRADVPPIPAALAHRPTVGALVKPWVNVELADGGVDFRSTHGARWKRCWQEGICQVCALPLIERPVVLLGGPNQLETYFTEPPLHPWCTAYVTRACPMVAGRMSHYPDRPKVAHGRRGGVCPVPGCDCGGWVPSEAFSGDHGGEPAHEWYAVWARSWTVAVSPDGRLLGGVPQGVHRTRVVSLPQTEIREVTE